MSDARKSIHALKTEYDLYRHMCGKVYQHVESGEKYIFIYPEFDEQTNEMRASYCLASMPWLKFTRPIDRFIERFTEAH